MKNPVYCIGHRHPDTDAVCSAIAYAYFKQQLGEEVIAARAGEINAETKYVLHAFGFAPPLLIEEFNTKVEEIMIEDPVTVHPWHTLRELGDIMRETGVKSVPVVDYGGKLAGIVSVGDLAKRYLEQLAIENIQAAGLTYANITRALGGTVLVGGKEDAPVRGRVTIGAMDTATMVNLLRPGDVLIVGDREKAQLAAIQHGVTCLVVTSGTPVSAAVRAEALRQGSMVISVPWDTFAAARLISLSIPVRVVMQQNVVTFKPDDLLEEARRVILKTKYRNYPVVDDGRVVGVVNRSHLIAPERKRVILVDHNEKSQAVEGIANAQILEIIDHHRLGGLETGEPIYVHHEPVGSTATIIANMFFARGVAMPPGIAGLLLGAVLSDTVMLRSPTTTVVDRDTAPRLAAIAGVVMEDFGMAMLRAGSDLAGRSVADIVLADFKEFRVDGHRVGIGQVTVMDVEPVLARRGELLEEMRRVRERDGFNLVLLMITGILAQSTHLLAVGQPRELLTIAFGPWEEEQPLLLPGVMSRKKQVVPPLMNAAKQLETR